MSVGIYTHYAQCDQTYFALRLADYLRAQGVDCSIYTDNQPARLKTIYDNAVVCRNKQRFTDWVQNKAAVVWTHVPKVEQINCAKRAGANTVLVPMWQELASPFRKAIKQADHLIALCTAARELFHDVYKFRNLTLIPFDTGLPVTKKENAVNRKCVRLLLPWYDRAARCTQSIFLDKLAHIVTYMPETRLTVCISSSKFSPAIAKFFQRLGVRTNGRVILKRNVPLAARPALFAANDLAIIPAECDNFGFYSLMSITCGTPIVSFAISPQTDFVYPESNGLLVKTKIDYDENGVPHASSDYDYFADALQELVASPQHIDLMNRKINYNLNSRRKSFELGWQSVLRLV